MRLSSIPRYYRNLRRWQEIIVVLRKYGLADWLIRLRLEFVRDWIKDEDGVPLANYSSAARLRMALTDLGPTFIKLGQVLSLRPDLVGSEVAQELQLLQSQVPADDFDEISKIVEQELGQPISSLFTLFESKPIASASIGQVHKATLLDGSSVVVKVQHVDIEKTVNEDLEVLRGLAVLAERIPELAAWQPRPLIERLSRSLRHELSFKRELSNIQTFHQLISKREEADREQIVVPRAFPRVSTSKVLTMEMLVGKSISQICNDPSITNERRTTIAKRVASLYIEGIFIQGIYHADPHPGNILILPEDKIGLLDFGMVGRIDDTLRGNIEEMLFAVISQDSALLTSLIKRAGKIPANIDDSQLSNDVSEFIATYATQPIETLDFADALFDVTDILHRHRITLPSQMSILIKTLITLQGTMGQLSPGFSLLESVQPLVGKLQRIRFSPRRQVRRLRRMYVEIEGLLERMPSQISSLLEMVQEGKLDVHLSHRGLSPSINRLVLGLLTSSLLLGSSILMASSVPPLLFIEPGPLGLHKVSILGLLGFIVASLVALRIMLAISKSGHLDTDDQDPYDNHPHY